MSISNAYRLWFYTDGARVYASRSVRELERKLTPDLYENTLEFFKKVLLHKKS